MIKHILSLGLGALLAVSAAPPALAQSTTTPDTNTGTTTATTTSGTSPIITAIAASPTNDGSGATITWSTDIPASSQVQYGTTTMYGTFSALFDAAGATSHTVTLGGLTPDTLYHFAVLSAGIGSTSATGTAMSLDQTFMTGSTSATSTGTVATSTNATSTSQSNNNTSNSTTTNNTTNTTNNSSNSTSSNTTNNTNTNNTTSNTSTDNANNTTNVTSTTATSTTDIGTLQQEIIDLQNRVTSLENQVSFFWSLFNQMGLSMGTSTQSMGAAFIDQQGGTYSAGGVIDFGGHNFMHEEQVVVTQNGATITTAHADGGGNFSTGSLRLPTTMGTYTYTFSGARGDSAQATITVQ